MPLHSPGTTTSLPLQLSDATMTAKLQFWPVKHEFWTFRVSIYGIIQCIWSNQCSYIVLEALTIQDCIVLFSFRCPLVADVSNFYHFVYSNKQKMTFHNILLSHQPQSIALLSLVRLFSHDWLCCLIGNSEGQLNMSTFFSPGFCLLVPKNKKPLLEEEFEIHIMMTGGYYIVSF